MLSHSSVYCGNTNVSWVYVCAENTFYILNASSPIFVFHS